MQAAGRRAEAQFLGHRNEIAKLAEIRCYLKKV